MVSDARILQLVAAGLMALALLAIALSSAAAPSRGRIGRISRENALSWSPRGLGGQGDRSPVFGLMWGLIFGSQAVALVLAVVLTVIGAEADNTFAFFNSLACAAAAFVLSAAWQPLFVINEAWAFAFAAALLCLAALIGTVGAIVAKGFLVAEWWVAFGAVATQFYSGWLIVAAGLGVGITTRAYNRGVGAVTQDADASLFPLVLSCVACALSILFAAPVIPVPLTLTFLFVPRVLSEWKLWSALVVSLVGIVVGSVMIAVYRAAGSWW